jgi:hypothetical protein
LLDRTAELRQRHHRKVELLGELLETAADLRNFLHAIISSAPLPCSLEQLEIIDDHHADALLPLEPASAGAERGDGEARRVVNVERQTLQLGSRAGERTELLLADAAHAQVFRADARLLGEDARGELVGRHFEAEQRDRCTGRLRRLDPVLLVLQQPLGRGKPDIGRKRALAHAGAAGDDH